MTKPGSPKFDVCGFGAINVDYVVAGPISDTDVLAMAEGDGRIFSNRRDLQRYIDGHEIKSRYIGGSAVNAVRALKAIDPALNVSIVGPLGELPAGLDLDDLGIDHSGVNHYDGPAGTCVSIVDDVDRKLLTYNNLEGIHKLLVADRDETVRALCRAKLLHVSSLLAPGAGPQVADILTEVRETTEHDIRICLDLGLPWAEDQVAAKKLLPLADVLLVSDSELSALLARPATSTRDQEAAAIGDLCDEYRCQPEIVTILKRRAQPECVQGPGPLPAPNAHPRPRVGGVLYQRDEGGGELQRHELLQEGLDAAQVVDSTGAGDFFASAVLAMQASARTRALQTLGLATALARHKFGHTAETAYRDVRFLPYGQGVPPSTGRVFVSHAHADKALVEALLAVLCPDEHERAESFFCTSQRDSGVRLGHPLYETVFTNLRAASSVICVVTPKLLASSACLQEVGGAQALRLRITLLKHPTFETWNEVKLPVNFNRGVKIPEQDELEIQEQDELKELRRELALRFGWPADTEDRWSTAIGELHDVLDRDDYPRSEA